MSARRLRPPRVRIPRLSSEDARRLARQFEAAAAAGVADARLWLSSPAGRRARIMAAEALIVVSPVLLRSRFFTTPVGRVVELAGGTALLVKIAEILRDWEPGPSHGRHVTKS